MTATVYLKYLVLWRKGGERFFHLVDIVSMHREDAFLLPVGILKRQRGIIKKKAGGKVSIAEYIRSVQTAVIVAKYGTSLYKSSQLLST